MGRGKRGGWPAASPGSGVLAGGAGELVGVIGLGDSDHRLAREKIGKQEGGAANTLERSEGPTTARWRAHMWFGGSTRRQDSGEAEREIESERESMRGS